MVLFFLHVCAKLLQSCLTFRNPMDHSPLSKGFSSQEYSMPSSGESSPPREGTPVS